MGTPVLKIALVTGEASGDVLAGKLIASFKAMNIPVEIMAVAGKGLAQTDVTIIQDNDVFAVMGLFEVLKDLPRLLRIKKQIVSKILDFEPHVYIGIDAPDLNFSIEKQMKKSGIPTVHYVSPSVWAWRPNRVYKMEHFIDLLLTLFPFEPNLYKKTGIKAVFCGHPTADSIALDIDKRKAKIDLGLSPDKPVLAILPGSRNREIKLMSSLFAEAVQSISSDVQHWQIATANVSEAKTAKSLQPFVAAQIECISVDSAQLLLKAADVALLASGTVALEALYCKTPMLVSYKISALTSFLLRTFKMMKTPYFSLPNVLHGDFLVPELMQEKATVKNIGQQLLQLLQQDHQELIQQFTQIHKSTLSPDPDCAARSIMRLVAQK